MNNLMGKNQVRHFKLRDDRPVFKRRLYKTTRNKSKEFEDEKGTLFPGHTNAAKWDYGNLEVTTGIKRGCLWTWVSRKWLPIFIYSWRNGKTFKIVRGQNKIERENPMANFIVESRGCNCCKKHYWDGRFVNDTSEVQRTVYEHYHRRFFRSYSMQCAP